MSVALQAYLNKLTMVSRKGKQHCAAEFAATVGAGTRAQLQPNPDQLAALPSQVAEACRQIMLDPNTLQATLQKAPAAAFEILERGQKRMSWKGTILLERVRVKKEEDRDQNAKAKIIFIVQFTAAQEWPGRELVGRWLEIAGMKDQRSEASAAV